MTNNLRLAVRAAVLLGTALLVAASIVLLEGGDGLREGLRGNLSIDDAKQFKEFPLYWLGEEFGGLPLTRISYVPRENLVLLIYGDCTPPRNNGGCAPPLALRIEPCRQTPPGRYVAGTGFQSLFDIGDAKAVFSPAGHLVLWTESVAISIFAQPQLATDAAEALVSLQQEPGVDSGLDPPGYPCF